MNTKVIIALIAGIALGAAGVQALHAQAKLPVYHVSEIDVTNIEGYTKEFVPLARASIITKISPVKAHRLKRVMTDRYGWWVQSIDA